MAQLPEDIIDRITAMERRIKQLSTAVNTRPALIRVGGSAIRIYDVNGELIIADDASTGGLGRPWLAMTPPADLTQAHWPQTSATGWTPIASSYNVVWQPQMHIVVQTAVSAGATGQVQVLVDGKPFGDVVSAGALLDVMAPVCPKADFPSLFGKKITVELQAKVTSASGTVYAQPLMAHGAQS
ncbi:hypothetical protein VSR01_24010 [Actinacidiphila sp. DG2A-62]|jgi:hypothetical protein|uniref:hypothetical protein n=1 Tax=Actinacidiphila sp. DG2A-62 TaxID=3108821 RepID=UPI002DBE2272|nr:hypothetical protein [Actinacidiphila sp. DG2A-62]MEC3996408.1 hypothetical protein [Actinacidiphila sp. DG2A-62]